VTVDDKLEPRNTAWTDRMKALVDEIEAARVRGNWYVVEIRAAELVIMCQMRRTR